MGARFVGCSKWHVAGLGALLAWGCSGGSEEIPDTSAADVKQEAAEMVNTASNYAETQRRELAARAQKAADEIANELSEAREELEGLPAGTQDQLRTAIERAEQARKTVGDEIADLQKAGKNSWETARDRLAAALDEMKEAREEVTAALAGRPTSEGES